MEPKLRISTQEEDGLIHIKVEALDSSRFKAYGFGTFMSDIKPGEIEITKRAKRMLLNKGRARSGLRGLEFWGENRLAWASLRPSLLVPIDDINVPLEAKVWIKKTEELSD